MGLPNEVVTALIGAANQGGYEIDSALRFRGGQSGTLSRTLGSASSGSTLATISFWLRRGRLTSSGGFQVFDCRTSGTDWDTAYSSRGLNDGTRGYTLYSQGGEFEFRTGKGILGNNTWHMSPRSGAHSSHTWYHVTSTYDGTTKQIWVNGVAGSTNNDSSNYAPNNLYSLRIGAGANESPTGNYFWVGELDEMRISSIKRSAD